MALLASTKKIKVAAAPMSPYSRNPMITAMAIATMDEFAPGRVIASPGTGNAAALKEAGMESPHPLQTMREYVEILRRYLQGETVNFHGKMFQINGAKMGFIPATPIQMYITAVRSQMLQLGGEIGDGVLLSAGCSPGYIRKCVGEIEAGAEKGGKSLCGCRRRRLRHRLGIGQRQGSDRSQQACFSPTFFVTCITPRIFAWAAAQSIRKGSRRRWRSAIGTRRRNSSATKSSSPIPWPARRRIAANSWRRSSKGGLNLPILLPTGTQEARKRVMRMAREILDKNY